MKKIIEKTTVPILLFLLIVTYGCSENGSNNNPENEVVVAAGIAISPTSIMLRVGDKQTPTANVMPEDTSNKAVVWATSN